MAFDNKRKLIIIAAIAICVMLCVGGVFKILGLTDFIIDKNIENNFELPDNVVYFVNTLLLWFNFGFFLIYSTKEYSYKIIPAWICSFPVLLACNNCDFLYGILVTSIVPALLIFMVKFDFTTMKRFGLIYLVTALYQLISRLVKMTAFSINPIITNENVFYNLIYSLDYYIFLLVFILIDVTKKEGD